MGERAYHRGDRVDIFSTFLRMLKNGREEIDELRSARFEEPKKRLILVLLDASDSMERVIDATREAVVKILKDSYVSRDEVAIIKFQGADADLVIKPTRNAIYADEKLRSIRVKGSTPLAAGFRKSIDFLRKVKSQYKNTLFVLVSDGNPNVSRDGDPVESAVKLAKELRRLADVRIFINPNPSLVEVPRKIAAALGAKYVELKSEEKTTEALSKMISSKGG